MMQAFVSPYIRRTIVGKSSSLSPTTIVRSFASIYHAEMEDLSQDETTSTSSSTSSSSSCAHSLLILGKPGGGKGTISGKILSDFPQFRHVSTGDQLRQHVRNETKLGLEAKKYMDGKFKVHIVVVYGVHCAAHYICSSSHDQFFPYINQPRNTQTQRALSSQTMS